MYAWHVPVLPAPSPGRLAVDELGRVHQYDAAATAWQRRDFEVKETASIFLNSVKLNAGQPPWSRIVCPGILGPIIQTWDDFYRRSLVEAQLVGDNYPIGGPRFYMADMTMAELQAWLQTIIPQSGGEYDCSVQLRIHEVFDPAIRCDQAMGYNLLYSQARGGEAYGHRLRGRHKKGLPSWHESAPGFDSGYFTDALKPFGRACLQQMFGITPATDDNGVVWFPIATRNLYGQLPTTGISIPSKGRTSYDVVAGAYTNVDDWFTPGAPLLLAMTDDPTPHFRSFENWNYLRGAQWVQNRARLMVVYPLTVGNLRAVFVKPYGIDFAALRLAPETQTSLPNMIVRARRIYSQGMASNYKIIPYEYGKIPNTLRIDIRDTIPYFRNGGIDDIRIPVAVRLHLYDPDTGLRSHEFDSEVRFLRRRRNLTLAPFMFRQQNPQ
jgi:hypothetical protein